MRMRTVQQTAAEIRKRHKAERLNLTQVAYELGKARSTAEKDIRHLTVLIDNDGGRRWKVTDLAEYIVSHEQEG